jgi:hypothetical protein
MSYIEIKRDNYCVELDEPTVHVDNQARGRSGHMSHAMAALTPDRFINFQSSCSAVRAGGHSAFGFIEYRFSNDNGKTYSETYELPYSKDVLMDGVYTISVEKAVVCNDGSLIAFCLRNTTVADVCCQPWVTPTYLKSTDGGMTWSAPRTYTPYEGRTYDARYHNGVIYALHLCNRDFLGTKAEHVYRIYQSKDNGESFSELCTVPIDPINRGYGALLIDAKGCMHVYAYNAGNEQEMDHAVSYDLGQSWTLLPPCYLDKGIRNPQVGYIDGVYVLHGRAGDLAGFVLYTSKDATNWDEGTLIVENKGAYAYYSNNLPLSDERGNFLLIQYSHPYRGACVNVMHTRLRIKPCAHSSQEESLTPSESRS